MKKRDLRMLLKDKLESREIEQIYKSYDIIGDIAIIRIPDKLKHQNITIAEAIMQLHKHVKSVWRQSSAVRGEFRLRKLEHVCGEKRTLTTHKEYGCVFKVDLAKCYFSPRLSYERMRIARSVKPREIVVNMFAGVGCYSIIIAKYSKVEKIYSIDVNPVAFQFMWENVLLNKVLEQVIPLKGDAKTIIAESLRKIADRVLMPLPEKAFEYIDFAVAALKPKSGWVHYYDFEHAKKGERPIEKVKEKVAEKLSEIGLDFAIPFSRVVRDTGPRWYQVVLDIQIKK